MNKNVSDSSKSRHAACRLQGGTSKGDNRFALVCKASEKPQASAIINLWPKQKSFNHVPKFFTDALCQVLQPLKPEQ